MMEIKDSVNIPNLKQHVQRLVSLPDFRNYENIESLNLAADYIKSNFESMQLLVKEQHFTINNRDYRNITAKAGLGNKKKIVVGAHYDVCGDQPGADDNASGVAGLIELARIIKAQESDLAYEIEFVAYSLEEPPFYGTNLMGSYFHAKSLKEKKEKIEAMLCFEMLGYYSEQEGSQDFPVGFMKLFYPSKGNFIAAVGNIGSRKLAKRFKSAMEHATSLPCETLSAPSFVPGVDFSDHRNYWKFGYRAIMITDTAFYRNPHYHSPADTIKLLDFEKIGAVVKGTAFLILSNIL